MRESHPPGGAGLRVLNLGGETVDTKSATGKLILTIFAGFAQFEREMMLELRERGSLRRKPRIATWGGGRQRGSKLTRP